MTLKMRMVEKQEFLHLLSDFANSCQNDDYKKIEYPMWRNLNQEIKELREGSAVTLCFCETYVSMMIKSHFCFAYNANSLGKYLLETYGYNDLVSYQLSNGTRLAATNAVENNEKVEKENKTMKFNFDFGPVDDNKVRMSMYGFAIKNPCGTYIAYDTKTNSIIDVDAFNFGNASKMVYKVPVALKDVAVGDVVVHNGKPMFVCMINGSELTVIDIYNGEKKGIIPTKSMFGFNFITKIVSLFSVNGFNASEDNPFGNMWPLLMMGDNKDMKDMLPLMLMANGGFDASNPMMLYALMGDNRCGDMLPLMLMMNQSAASAKPAPAHECKCGGNCENK